MRILITAGPTREPIDEVRFISNRSSGTMGLALAEAASAAGHEVTLLLGPGPVAPAARAGLTVHRFTSAADLAELLAAHFPANDVLVMAAAVSDYRPAHIEPGKRAREAGGAGSWTLALEPTPDVVAAAAAGKRADQRVVAFALEAPGALESRARAKLGRKGVDAIVANPLATMESADIEPTWLTASGGREVPGPMSKPAFARWLVERIARLSEA